MVRHLLILLLCVSFNAVSFAGTDPLVPEEVMPLRASEEMEAAKKDAEECGCNEKQTDCKECKRREEKERRQKQEYPRK
jgi:hypothetical protein